MAIRGLKRIKSSKTNVAKQQQAIQEAKQETTQSNTHHLDLRNLEAIMYEDYEDMSQAEIRDKSLVVRILEVKEDTFNMNIDTVKIGHHKIVKDYKNSQVLKLKQSFNAYLQKEYGDWKDYPQEDKKILSSLGLHRVVQKVALLEYPEAFEVTENIKYFTLFNKDFEATRQLLKEDTILSFGITDLGDDIANLMITKVMKDGQEGILYDKIIQEEIVTDAVLELFEVDNDKLPDVDDLYEEANNEDIQDEYSDIIDLIGFNYAV